MQHLFSWWTAQTAIFYLQHIAQSSAPSARLSSPQGMLYSVMCACHCLVLHSHPKSIDNLLSGEHATYCSQQAGHSNYESPDCGGNDADCTMDQGSDAMKVCRLQSTCRAEQRTLQHGTASQLHSVGHIQHGQQVFLLESTHECVCVSVQVILNTVPHQLCMVKGDVTGVGLSPQWSCTTCRQYCL